MKSVKVTTTKQQAAAAAAAVAKTIIYVGYSELDITFGVRD
jgi:hypothetical protein